MKVDREHVKAILEAIHLLLELKVLIRKSVPNYEFNDKEGKLFSELICSLQDLLEPLFLVYGGSEKREGEIEEEKKKKILLNVEELKTAPNIILISSNTVKKKLKKMGVDPRKLIATGGPFFIEDFKKINPSLTPEALTGIEKKCQNLISQLKREKWDNKDLIFIKEENNPTDNLILERIPDISDIIGKEVKVIKIKSWDMLDQ
ncbi:MAG: DUF2100 domain-containing protein [Promethearchaeota archaeon]